MEDLGNNDCSAGMVEAYKCSFCFWSLLLLNEGMDNMETTI